MKILPFTKTNIETIVRQLDENMPVIMPTDTIYGIHLPYKPDNLSRINELKQRAADQLCNVIYAKVSQITNHISNNEAKVIVNIGNVIGLTTIVSGNHDDGLAIRKIQSTDNPLLHSILLQSGPLYSTSANVSGETYIHDPSVISEKFNINIYRNVSHETHTPNHSTIVDIRSTKPTVIRGHVSDETLSRLFHK